MADRTVLIPVHELYVEGPIDMGGIKKGMTIVFYGDKNNREATYGGAVHSYKAGDSFLEVVNTLKRPSAPVYFLNRAASSEPPVTLPAL